MVDDAVMQPIPPEFQIPTVIAIVAAGLSLQLVLGYVRNKNQNGEKFDKNKAASSIIVGIFSAIILISPQVANLEYNPERPVDLLVTLVTLLATVAGFDTIAKKVIKIETDRKSNRSETIKAKQEELQANLNRINVEESKKSRSGAV